MSVGWWWQTTVLVAIIAVVATVASGARRKPGSADPARRILAIRGLTGLIEAWRGG